MSRSSLNHSYRLVWSDVTQAYVAVAENVKSCGKRKSLVAAIALAILPSFAAAIDLTSQSPNGQVLSADSDYTVLSGATIAKNSGGTGLQINPNSNLSPYSSTFTNLGTVHSTAVLSSGANFTLSGLLFGASNGVSDITGQIINGAGSTIKVDASQEYIAAGSFGVGTVLRVGNVLGAIQNNGTISARILNEGGSVITIGVQTANIAGSGTFTNSQSGLITSNAFASNLARATGIEIVAFVNGAILNEGRIAASAIGLNTFASAINVRKGVDSLGGVLNANLTNAAGASFTARAESSVGTSSSTYTIQIEGDVNDGATVSNSGVITANSETFGLSNSNGNASASAIHLQSNLAGNITNSDTGSISATSIVHSGVAFSSASAVAVNGSMLSSASFSNSGLINAVASSNNGAAHANAMFVVGDVFGAISNNSGQLNATASLSGSLPGQFDNIIASSIEIHGNLSGSINNAFGASIQAVADATGNPVIVANGSALANGISVVTMGDDAPTLVPAPSAVIANAGSIIVGSGSAMRSAESNGINVGVMYGGSISNDGLINVGAGGLVRAEARGIYISGIDEVADGNLSGQLTIGAAGVITVAANATGSNGDDDNSAYAAGVGMTGDLFGSLVNAGQISASADNKFYDGEAIAAGIDIRGAVNVLTNDGVILATALTGMIDPEDPQSEESDDAIAYGINVGSITESGVLKNSLGKTITATATSTDNDAEAYGLRVSNAVAGNLQNFGTIKAIAIAEETAQAFGIGVGEVSSTGTILNNGSITVTATGRNGFAEADGILIAGILSGTVINNGSIDAVASATADGSESAFASGIFAENVTASGRIENFSSIKASASASTEEVLSAGIYARTLDGTIVNSGSISGISNRPDSRGYSIYVEEGSGTIENKVGGVLQGGLFAGGSVNVINAGTISLIQAAGGQGFVSAGNIGGNFEQTSTGVLEIGAYAQSGVDVTPYSRLTVGGNASIAGTAFVDVREIFNPSSSQFTPLAVGGVLKDVVTVNGALSGNFASIADNSSLFNFVSVVSDEGNIGFRITSSSSSSALSSVTSEGNRYARGAAGAIDAIIAGGETNLAMQEVINQFGMLETDKTVADAAIQTVPLVAGAVSHSVLGTLNTVNRIVQARQEGQYGKSSGDSFAGDEKFWFKPFGSWSNQDERNGNIGYKADAYGMIFGADATLSDVNRVGVAFAYSNTNVDTKGVANQNAKVDSYTLALYGSRSLSESLELSYQADVGYHDTEGKRTINFAGVSDRADSNYDSWSGHIGFGLAKAISLSETSYFTPSVRADYSYFRSNSYSESGAGALSLNVGKQTTDAFVVGVDGKYSKTLSDKVTLVANLGVGYDLINDRASLSSSFAGAPTVSFVTEGVEPSPWLVRAGFGIVGKLSETTEISARYDIEARESYDNQTASVKVRWGF